MDLFTQTSGSGAAGDDTELAAVSQRFYNSVVIWSMIRPTPEPQAVPRLQHPDWRDFLDGLCFLADYCKGGDTVTSIGVEDTPGGIRYWIAANKGLRFRALEHLRWVMGQLRRLRAQPNIEHQAIEDVIVRESVAMCSRKITGYRKDLMNSLQQLWNRDGPYAVQGANSALLALRDFEGAFESGFDLCELAYDFRSGACMLLLNTRRHSDPIVASIRHCIGRLGLWRKVAKQIISFALRNPPVVANYELRPIPMIPDFRPPIQTITLQQAMRAVFPGGPNDLTTVALHLNQLGVDLNADTFPWRLNTITQKAHIHAELIVAEHFHRNQLTFHDDYRYIGCSKASCYCCDKYLRRHPGNFVPRPCHGNIWIKWLAPFPSGNRHDQSSLYIVENLNRMTDSIREDIELQLVTQQSRAGRRPDSATGITTARTASSMML